MNVKNYLISLLFISSMSITSINAQTKQIIPDLSVNIKKVNREASFADGVVTLNARSGNGLYILKNIDFSNGRIELDVKGENRPQQSFVGFAYHGVNDSTFDAVYFRPFNFKNPDRDTHSVQYISMPEHDWYELRQNFPGKYENKLTTVPDPDGWFHVSIEIRDPEVKVYVNNDKNPSLTVSQIDTQSHGWVGFWVGNGSDGNFRNLKIYPGQ